MNIKLDNKTIWQQAAGDSVRNYINTCLEWDVILNGPGNEGKWPDCKEKLRKNNWNSNKISDLRRFCEEMSDGDIVVLRLETKKFTESVKLLVHTNEMSYF